MILRAVHIRGILDISSQQTHRDINSSGEDFLNFRLALKPGQTVEVDDRYRRLKNIDAAIRAGLLQVVSFNPSVISTYVHTADGESENGTGQGTTSGGVNLNGGETKTVDEADLTDCRTVKWFISVEDTTNGTFLSSEIFANHNGSSANWTEHSSVGSADTVFEVDVSGGKIRLRATATSNGQMIKTERLCVSI